ncbi:outer membrane protein assembly factor BamB [Hamadaea flava]|uniref:PQQ-binding-like beta-propeller repeat protein n=1 Tax=Hamadaea flava TaxID=1742688 RepID=A0ABV8LQE8_9ACTN|nr:PQQ-binding-like beta-propeller repeat protein [Hamadaea flava]MCP2321529.1 outer membrane protein assembly factor BamB [Hamadaea flava]
MTLIDLDASPPPPAEERPARLSAVRAALRRRRTAVLGGALLTLVLATQAAAAPGVPAVAPIRLPAVAVDGTVLVSGGRAYIVTGRDFELRAYSLVTGRQLWAYQSGRPIVDLRDAGGLVLVMTPQATRVGTGQSPVTTPGLIVALDGVSGAKRWEHFGLAIPGSFTPGVLVVQDATGLVGLRLGDGGTIWHDPDGQPYPAYTESGQVLVGTYVADGTGADGTGGPDGHVRLGLLDAATGRTTPLGSLTLGTMPILAAGSSGVLVLRADGGVLTYGLATAGADPTAVMAVTTVASNASPDAVGDPRCGRLMCLNLGGEVTAADPVTGRTVWRRDGEWIGAQLPAGDGVLLALIPARSTAAVLVDAETGKTRVELGVWRAAGTVGDRVYALYEPRRTGRAWLGVVDGDHVRAVADLGSARACRVVADWLLCAGDGATAGSAWRLTSDGVTGRA